ncbi:unnamed protein product [Cunninghamella blakesleeana]
MQSTTSSRSNNRRSLPDSYPLPIQKGSIQTKTSIRPKSSSKKKANFNEAQTKLFNQMREIRTKIFGRYNLTSNTSVYTDEEFMELIIRAPQNEQEFLCIVPDQERFYRYGKQYFLSLCKQN